MAWEFVYDKDFNRVYDKDHQEAIDMSWDGEVLKVSTTEDVVLDLAKVVQLRKALQWVERRAKT